MQSRPSTRYIIVTLVVLLCALPALAQDQSTNASFLTGTKEAIPSQRSGWPVEGD